MPEKIFIGDKPVGDAHGAKLLGIDAGGATKNFPVATQSQAEAGTGQELMTALRTKQQIDALTADFAEVVANSYSPTAADNQKFKVLTDPTGVDFVLPNDTPAGVAANYIQGGAGQISFSAGAGATVHQADGFTNSRTQWSSVTAAVLSNVDGSSAVWLLVGDME